MTNEMYVMNLIEKFLKDYLEVDMYEVMSEIRSAFEPEDIFSEKTLKRWAKNNGYVHDSLVKEYHNEE